MNDNMAAFDTRRSTRRVNLVVIYSTFFLLSLVFCRRFFNLFDWSSHCMTEGDPGLNAWALDWVTRALTTHPSKILDGNAF